MILWRAKITRLNVKQCFIENDAVGLVTGLNCGNKWLDFVWYCRDFGQLINSRDQDTIVHAERTQPAIFHRITGASQPLSKNRTMTINLRIY